MRIATVREFRDKATLLLRGKAPILVTRHGKLAGIFFPSSEESLPLEFKRELYSILSGQIARELRKRKVTEDEVLTDFEGWRRNRREARRRR